MTYHNRQDCDSWGILIPTTQEMAPTLVHRLDKYIVHQQEYTNDRTSQIVVHWVDG